MNDDDYYTRKSIEDSVTACEWLICAALVFVILGALWSLFK